MAAAIIDSPPLKSPQIGSWRDTFTRWWPQQNPRHAPLATLEGAESSSSEEDEEPEAMGVEEATELLYEAQVSSLAWVFSAA